MSRQLYVAYKRLCRGLKKTPRYNTWDEQRQAFLDKLHPENAPHK